ncbi:hypothetical protein JI435_022790 [Parastagonospora nodorum SN15]|uniref:Uncharacterized protein n=1 Tax=Phaeosphaeria nodorum (strain SN15 / ATCC MYA-4574 / FGSC 10173) TaxID=321614 RepID=A0A7U2HXW8_PHANO|nr:hypothetical protein JI435_022790 [Parastagonospora nodorum SN15]
MTMRCTSKVGGKTESKRGGGGSRARWQRGIDSDNEGVGEGELVRAAVNRDLHPGSRGRVGNE